MPLLDTESVCVCVCVVFLCGLFFFTPPSLSRPSCYNIKTVSLDRYNFGELIHVLITLYLLSRVTDRLFYGSRTISGEVSTFM